MSRIVIETKEVDNILDLANLLKYFLRAEVIILPESEESIALVAHMNVEDIFASYRQYDQMTVFVFMNKMVKVYFHNNFLVRAMHITPKHMETGDEKCKVETFESIGDFVDFVRPHTVPIEFPEIDVSDFKEIDLGKREEVLNKWKEVIEKLIPYGVLVENQLDKHISDSDWIFQLQLPTRPVPKELAVKNEYDGKYHDNYDTDHLISFYPGCTNWNQQYKKIVEHLKELYAFEEVN